MTASRTPRHVAMLTGGGDAPGMNAALRAVASTALSQDPAWTVHGIRNGFWGLLTLTDPDVPWSDVAEPVKGDMLSWAVREGGSWLGTIRAKKLVGNEAGQEAAVRRLVKEGIDAIVVIGGDGSLRGAYSLHQAALRLRESGELQTPFAVVGIPASIDNDIPCTALSLGVDTALNTIVSSVDKLTDTGSAVNRVFVMEVMGVNCGYLPILGALASGAEGTFYPEGRRTAEDVENLMEQFEREYRQGRRYAAIVCGERATFYGFPPTQFIQTLINTSQRTGGSGVPWDVRTSILGHLQRGGPVSAFDRILSTVMGAEAIRVIARGEAETEPRMITWQGNWVGPAVPLKEVFARLAKGDTATGEEYLKRMAATVKVLSKRPEAQSGPAAGAIAVMTVGADAPGMNIVLRAVSRFASNCYGWATWGVKDGLEGLTCEQPFESVLSKLQWEAVGSTGPRGPASQRRAGSCLGVGRRFEGLMTQEEKERAYEKLRELKKRENLRGVVFIGGMPTALCVRELGQYFAEKELNVPLLVLPASIDHGLPQNLGTLGFDSALNVIVNTLDNIGAVGQATGQISLVETMGRRLGALPLMGALAGGADFALIGEEIESPRDAAQALTRLQARMGDREHATIVVKEALYPGYELDRLFGQAQACFSNQRIRCQVLGYTQRGASPSFIDRTLGTLLGVAAAETLHSLPADAPTPLYLAWKLDGEGDGLPVIHRHPGLFGGDIVALPLMQVYEGWSEATAVQRSRPLWHYEELRDLFAALSQASLGTQDA
jgi:6-phosphofructokinase 1